MALLRNRQVSVIGTNGAEVSPIYTVMYPDGTREDVPLKFIQMTEAEHKQFQKINPQHADYVRVIDDKDHTEVLDSQNVKKIKEKQAKGTANAGDTFVPAKTFVKASDVDQAKPQAEIKQTPEQLQKSIDANTVDNTLTRQSRSTPAQVPPVQSKTAPVNAFKPQVK